MDNNAVALAALTLAGTLAGGFFALVNKQNATHQKIADALEKVAKSNEKIAEETHKGNLEAKERNGHLGDQNLRIGEMVANISAQLEDAAERNYQAIRNVKEQKVEHQTVHQETVIRKGDENG